MNKLKMMTATRFTASRTIAMRIDTGDGNVAAAVEDATQRLINMGLNKGMAAEIALDVRDRLVGDTELHRYQRLLSTNDWTYAYSDCSRTYAEGSSERGRLMRMAGQLDPELKLWREYQRCE